MFFFKQKTAYELIWYWSSDVCSSDLTRASVGRGADPARRAVRPTDARVHHAHVRSGPPAGEAGRGRDQRGPVSRSEERRVGKEGMSWWAARGRRLENMRYHYDLP